MEITVSGPGINPAGTTDEEKNTITLTYGQLPWESGNLSVGEKYTVSETNASGLNANYTLVTTGDDASTTEIKDLEITADGVEAELINNYERKQAKLTVKKTWEGDDIGDEAKADLEITVSGPGINPAGTTDEEKNTITLTYDQLPWESGNLPVGEKYTVSEIGRAHV